MKSLLGLSFGVLLALLGSAAGADLVIIKTPNVDAVEVRRCDDQTPPVCATRDFISGKQFRQISKKVARMTTRRLLSMAVIMKATPFMPTSVFDDYGYTRRTSESLKHLLKSDYGGSVRIEATKAGADRIIELFLRAVDSNR